MQGSPGSDLAPELRDLGGHRRDERALGQAPIGHGDRFVLDTTQTNPLAGQETDTEAAHHEHQAGEGHAQGREGHPDDPGAILANELHGHVASAVHRKRGRTVDRALTCWPGFTPVSKRLSTEVSAGAIR